MTKQYIKNIIFTKTPLTGKFKYEDVFQVYPLNLDNAPNSKNTDHFPVIIEFWYDSEELPNVEEFNPKNVNNWIAETTAQTNRLIELTNLLSSITNYQFFFYRKPETYWSVPLPEEKPENINDISSSWSASLYYYPEIGDDLKIEGFSEPDFKEILLIPQKRYYWYNPVEGKDKEIEFPALITNILEQYFSINGNKKRVVLSSIYQICNGLELFYRMKSLSFFSFVSGIETLVNYEFKDEKVEYICSDCKTLKSSERSCKKCGNPIWGVAAKYRDFLYKYVSDEPNAKKMYNKIYTIRSKITHTDYLMNGENFMNWEFNDKTDEISTKHLEAMQLARRSLINWILKSK